MRDAFELCKDESDEYPIDDKFRDDHNLKSRTLGNWVIGRDKIHRIRYIIAINTGADNAVVAAYKVSLSIFRIEEKRKRTDTLCVFVHSLKEMIR